LQQAWGGGTLTSPLQVLKSRVVTSVFTLPTVLPTYWQLVLENHEIHHCRQASKKWHKSFPRIFSKYFTFVTQAFPRIFSEYSTFPRIFSKYLTFPWIFSKDQFLWQMFFSEFSQNTLHCDSRANLTILKYLRLSTTNPSAHSTVASRLQYYTYTTVLYVFGWFGFWSIFGGHTLGNFPSTVLHFFAKNKALSFPS
jgi:hypothetical protein